jgi:hypothetical protein
LLTWPHKEDQVGGEAENEEAEEPLESDRPDFTDSSTTVGFQRLQIESGYTFTHAVGGEPTHEVHDLPELLVRYGLAERLELRVTWNEGMVFEHYRDRSSGRLVLENGSTDVMLGLKYALTKQDRWRPQSSFVAEITAPAGTPFLSSGQVDVFLNYLYSWELSKRLSLNCGTGDWWTAELADRFSIFFQSASVEYELTEKLHIYNEWFALFPRGSTDNRPQHYYDGGLTYLVAPDFQLDWRAGLGLNGGADGFFTGCGLTIRR